MLSAPEFATQMLVPSKAIATGDVSVLNVPSGVPSRASLDSPLLPAFAIQMLSPSKPTARGFAPTGNSP